VQQHYRYSYASDSSLVTEVQSGHSKQVWPYLMYYATISKTAACVAPMVFGAVVGAFFNSRGAKLPFDPFLAGCAISILVWLDSCGFPMLRGRRYMKRDALYYDGRQSTFEAGPEGFRVASDIGISEVPWSAVRSLILTKRAIGMWVGKGLHYLPKSVFRNEAEQSEFIATAKTWMANSGQPRP
jgi:hypothetical protein